MNEEEKAIRMQFQNILNNLVNNKIAPTGTAILAAEQPMILLFEELMYKIQKQQKELEQEKQKNKENIEALEEWINGERISPKCISKDKIREKIKEYEELVKEFEEYWSKDIRKFKKEKSVDYYKIEALQELLEE